jgi:hypothetical protein
VENLLGIVSETLHVSLTIEKLSGLESDTFRQGHHVASSLIEPSQLIAQVQATLIALEKSRCLQVRVIKRLNAGRKTEKPSSRSSSRRLRRLVSDKISSDDDLI